MKPLTLNVKFPPGEIGTRRISINGRPVFETTESDNIQFGNVAGGLAHLLADIDKYSPEWALNVYMGGKGGAELEAHLTGLLPNFPTTNGEHKISIGNFDTFSEAYQLAADIMRAFEN